MDIDLNKWEYCSNCIPSCKNCINMYSWDKYGKPTVCFECKNKSNYESDDNFCSECGRPLNNKSIEILKKHIK